MGPGATAGSYAFEACTVIRSSPADLLPWLVTPDLMRRWMVRVGAIDELPGPARGRGARTRLTTGWTPYLFSFLGELVDADERGVSRRYQLVSSGRVVPIRHLPAEYERVVRYRLEAGTAGTAGIAGIAGTAGTAGAAGTRVTCAVVTTIPGLAPAAARSGGRHEARSLALSLRRLRQLVETGSIALPTRLRSRRVSGQPL